MGAAVSVRYEEAIRRQHNAFARLASGQKAKVEPLFRYAGCVVEEIDNRGTADCPFGYVYVRDRGLQTRVGFDVAQRDNEEDGTPPGVGRVWPTRGYEFNHKILAAALEALRHFQVRGFVDPADQA